VECNCFGKNQFGFGVLENSSRFGLSLLDFFYSTPVAQQPIILMGGSWATTYLVNLGIKALTKYWGSTLIFVGINYLSTYNRSNIDYIQ
jgi:hypothetical protein